MVRSYKAVLFLCIDIWVEIQQMDWGKLYYQMVFGI